MTTYLDYNATTPVSKGVADLIYKLMTIEFGNAGSRTHEFGVTAKRAVEQARAQVANVVGADKADVIFTSGATESNNIAILGLKNHALETGKKHIITSKIEHKAVLEPIEHLELMGLEVTYLDVDEDGLLNPNALKEALRDDTLLVSLMHINNETGVIQPVEEVCEVLGGHEAYLHVDAAQSYAKYPDGLDNERIDMISVSGHKLYAPKGVGALVLKRRDFLRPPLKPIMFGGGQEKGLRPGTLAVPLIAGLGLACEIALREHNDWRKLAQSLKHELLEALGTLGAQVNGQNTSPYVLNFSVPGVNSEAAMVALKGIAAVSNGSACTSQSYTPSHVLTAMGLPADRVAGAIRVSWGPFTSSLPTEEITSALKGLM